MAATSIILSLSGHGALFLLLLLLPLGCWGDADPQLAYEEGYFKREHSLVQPYQGQGMELPFWDFTGSTVVTNQYVRLTPDRQSKQGTIWNRVVGFYTAHTIYIIIIMIMAHLATCVHCTCISSSSLSWYMTGKFYCILRFTVQEKICLVMGLHCGILRREMR